MSDDDLLLELLEGGEDDVVDFDRAPTFVMDAKGYVEKNKGQGFEFGFQHMDEEGTDDPSFTIFDVLVFLASVMSTADSLYQQNLNGLADAIHAENPELDRDEIAKNVHANTLAQLYKPEDDSEVEESSRLVEA